MKNFLPRARVAAAGWTLVLLALPGAAWADYFVTRDTPSWFKESFLDFPEEVGEAADAGKRMMIYFGQDGCPYCEHLHNTSFRQTDLLALMQTHFDAVAINIFGDVDVVWTDGEEYNEKTLARKLGVQFTPSLMFLDENGEEILRLAGYQPPEKLGIALQYAVAYPQVDAESFPTYYRAALAGRGKSAPLSASLPAAFAQPPYDFAALAKADRPLLAFVVQDDCPYCREWQDYLQADDYAQQFDIVRIDLFGRAASVQAGGSAAVSEAQWAADNAIAFVPALVFFDRGGQEVFRVDGYLRSYHLATALRYVGSGAYRREPEFQRFLQARADEQRAAGEEVVIW